jgi:hypothetical protein
MVPFSTLSLKKWYLTSMCLVLEWSTEFLASLWHWCYHKEVGSGCTPHGSLSKCMKSTTAGNNNARPQHAPPRW